MTLLKSRRWHEEPAPASTVISLGGGHTVKPLIRHGECPHGERTEQPAEPPAGWPEQARPRRPAGWWPERPRRVQPLTFNVRLRRQPASWRVAAFFVCAQR